jgi:Tfp pilus assembly protein PilN
MIAKVNLLPVLKQEKLKQRRTRQLAISIGVTVIAIAIAVPILLFIYRTTQGVVLSRTQKSIDEKQQQIAEFEDIETMLTVKQDLAELPALYMQRVYTTQLLKILPSVTPVGLVFTNLDIEGSGNFTISGETNSYVNVEKLFSGLQRADVKDVNPDRVEPDPDKVGYFTNLFLESVSGASGDQVSFTISGQFDPKIVAPKEEATDGQE